MKKVRIFIIAFLIAVIAVTAAVILPDIIGRDDEPNIPEGDTSPTHYVPTVEEVKAAWEAASAKAWEFRGTSTLGSLYGDSNDTFIGDTQYLRVTKFETYAHMEAYLNESFSPELTKELIAYTGVNIEHDGKVYSAPADRGSNIGIGSTRVANIVGLSEDAVSLTIITETEVLDYEDRTDPAPTGKVIGIENHEFTYEYLDGKWVFTSFPNIELTDYSKFNGYAANDPSKFNIVNVSGMKVYLDPHYSAEDMLMWEAGKYEDAIATFYYKPEYEKSGAGEILTIFKLSCGDYERNVLANFVTPHYTLGHDGECYYVMTTPTDVQGDPFDGTFCSVNNSTQELVKTLFGKVNMLAEVDEEAFYEQEFTYDGEHKFVRYYPYGKGKDLYHTIVLSQPATKGEGGIWCVERWYSEGHTSSSGAYQGYIMLHFPEESEDLAAKKYYEYAQEAYDNGAPGYESLGDTDAVAMDFVHNMFGFAVTFENALEYTDSLPDGSYHY